MQYHCQDRDNLAAPPALIMQVTTEPGEKPGFRLLSFPQGRAKLMSDGKVISWLYVDPECWGGYIVKTQRSWRVMPPISAADLERVGRAPLLEQPAKWRLHFAQRLAESTPTLLYGGLWLLEQQELCAGCGVEEVFRHTLDHIQLGARSGHPAPTAADIIALKEHEPDSARLKWWRKKVGEQTLPPVLLWYVAFLDRYLILDGHQRLAASLLEQQPCPLLVLYSVTEVPVASDPLKQQRLLAALAPNIPVDRLNGLLIKLFDDSPHYLPVTRAWAAPYAVDDWESELTGYLLHRGLDELIADVDLEGL